VSTIKAKPGAAIERANRAALGLGWAHPMFLPPKTRCNLTEDATVPTACIDAAGRLRVNPEFVLGLTDRQVMFLVGHELLHYILLHGERRQERNVLVEIPGFGIVLLWNVVGDMLINHFLTQLRVGDHPIEATPGAVLPEEPGDGDLTAEELYDKLLKRLKDSGRTSRLRQASSAGPAPAGKGPSSDGRGHDESDGQGQSKDGQENPHVGCGCGVKAPPKREDEDEGVAREDQEQGPGQGLGSDGPSAEDLRNARKECAAQAKAMARMGHGQGSGAGDALAKLLDTPPARVRWDQVLRGVLTRALAMHGRDDVSYSLPNRRTKPWGPIFPGEVAYKAKVAVVIDTSGSMSDAALSRCVAETVGIIKATGVRAFLVTHDDGVQWQGWIAAGAPVGQIKAACKGRGGTSFGAAYRAVQDEGRFDALVHLTDGGVGHWPETPEGTRGLVVGLIGTYHDAIPKDRHGVRVIEVETPAEE
jgi:predicted metal-dependent peptidase